MFDRLAGKDLPVTLVLAHCAAGGNSAYVTRLYQLLASRRYPGLRLTETSFPYGHVEMDDPSFENAITNILG